MSRMRLARKTSVRLLVAGAACGLVLTLLVRRGSDRPNAWSCQVEVLKGALPKYLVGGTLYELGGLQNRLRLLATDAPRDHEGLSMLCVEIAALPGTPYEYIRKAMVACAQAGIWRVIWRKGSDAVSASIYKERTPPPFNEFSSVEYPHRIPVKVGRPSSGSVYWSVLHRPVNGPREAANTVRNVVKSTTALIELDVEDDVPFGDVFITLKALQDVPFEVAISYISVAAPPRPDNPWCRGMQDAKRDVAEGRLAIISYGLPVSAFFYWEPLLLKRYGVISDHRGCCIEVGDDAYAEAYNHVSKAAMFDRFGLDVARDCWRDAKAIERGEKPELLKELQSDEKTRWMVQP